LPFPFSKDFGGRKKDKKAKANFLFCVFASTLQNGSLASLLLTQHRSPFFRVLRNWH